MKVKQLKLLPILLLGFLIYGCASGPSFSEYVPKIPKLDSEHSRIYVYRPGTFRAVLQPKVALDGQPVGVAVSKGFFYVDTTPGEHELSVLTKKENKLKFSIDKGETKYIRLHTTFLPVGSRVKPLLVKNAQGMQEISDTHYKFDENDIE